jgi:hypothetical protein
MERRRTAVVLGDVAVRHPAAGVRHVEQDGDGLVKGGENKRKPRAHEVFRERVEVELEDWLRPYYAARDSGDQALALKAADSILDRAYGRARQATELSGPDGGAITIEQLAVKMLADEANTGALEAGGDT